MKNKNALARRKERAPLAGVRRELASLDSMSVGELAAKYGAVFGVPTRSRNKKYLQHHIAWRIQELAEGGLSRRALDQIEQLAPQAPARWRPPVARRNGARDPGAADGAIDHDPRLPPVGTMLTRLHGGIEHCVTVLARGFEYNGERHRTLSAIARQITGKSWNGYVFFLGRGQRVGAAAGAGGR